MRSPLGPPPKPPTRRQRQEQKTVERAVTRGQRTGRPLTDLQAQTVLRQRGFLGATHIEHELLSEGARRKATARQKRIDRLIDVSVKGHRDPGKVAQDLLKMKLSPAEKRYVSQASAARDPTAGNRSIRLGDIGHALGEALRPRPIGENLHTIGHIAGEVVKRRPIGENIHTARRATEIATGIDPADPLKHGVGQLALGTALFGAPLAGRAVGVGVRAGARAVETAQAGKAAEAIGARKALGRLAEERGSVRIPWHGGDEDVLFHGSPEGPLDKVDALYHTRGWREGPGFYLTSSREKAEKYAAGRTARGERKNLKGAVSSYRLKKGTKVLDLEAQNDNFWRKMAERITGDKVDPKVYRDWASDSLERPHMKGASPGVHGRQGLVEYLTGYHEMPQTDAYYAIEEAVHDLGYQATRHLENGVPVHVVKDEAALERVGGGRVPPKPSSVTRLAEERGPQQVEAGGGGPPRPPERPTGFKPAEKPPEAALPEAEKIVGSLPKQKQLRREQEKLRSAERGRRAEAAEEAFHAAGGGSKGVAAAFEQLRGELPKLQMPAGERVDFDDQALFKLIDHAWNEAGLQKYEKIRTMKALQAVTEGRVLQKNQIRLLEEVYGVETAAALKEAAPQIKKYGDVGKQLWNLPRAVAASFDVSAPFRQGLVAIAGHPIISGRNFVPMLRAFGSEKTFHAIQSEIVERPNFELYDKFRLALTGLTRKEAAKEERFMYADMAERIPGVGGSSRAFQAYLNKTRADIFDHLYSVAEEQAASTGREVADEVGKSIANFVNVATGRGHAGPAIEKATEALNHFLFSPRLMYSRLQMLNPRFYAQLDPIARKDAVKSMAVMVGALGSTLYLLKQAGLDVGIDPRSANFARVRFGRTRVDLLGGFEPYMVLAARLMTGQAINSETGELSRLGPGFSETSRGDILTRFASGKLNPQTQMGWEAFTGETFGYDPFEWQNIWKNYVPLLWADTADVYRDHGVPWALGAYGLGAFGIGVSSWGDQPQKRNGVVGPLPPPSPSASAPPPPPPPPPRP